MAVHGPLYFFREYEGDSQYLSQWYTAPFTAPPPANSKSQDPMTFVTTEQYMMYHKAVVFEDWDIAEKIIKENSPKKQKGLGRKVSGFNPAVWDKHKEQVVEDGNWYKFTQGKENAEEMKRLLLATGDRKLVEASPFDRIWGVGFDAANACKNKARWGQNLLGNALMRVRDRIQQEQQESNAAETQAKM